MRRLGMVLVLASVACSGGGGSGGAGGGGSGGGGGTGGTGGFVGEGRDPACPATDAYITRAEGSIADASGAPIADALAGMCLRFGVVGGTYEAATCLDLAPSDANGDFVVDVPLAQRCMSRAAVRLFYYPNPPAPPTDSTITTYCHVALPLDATTVTLPGYVLYQAAPPSLLPPLGVAEDSRTVVFDGGLEIDVTPHDFFATYELLAAVSVAPDDPGLCFIDDPSSLYRVFGLRPEGEVREIPVRGGFGVRIPNDEDLAPGTEVALYILGGLLYELADGTKPEEGDWVRFGTATVSADRSVIEGDPLPFINWFGYGPISILADTMATTRQLVIHGVWLGLAACSGSGTGDGGSCAAGERTGYPEGPFGLVEGDIIADLEFTSAASEPVTLGDVHRTSDSRLVLLSTAAFWCTACIDEQPTLQSWHEQWGPEGLAVVVTVFEDLNTQPATAAHAGQWADQYGVDFLVLADPPFVMQPYYPDGDTSATPLNLVLDACTMEIIYSSVGADASALEAIIEANL